MVLSRAAFSVVLDGFLTAEDETPPPVGLCAEPPLKTPIKDHSSGRFPRSRCDYSAELRGLGSASISSPSTCWKCLMDQPARKSSLDAVACFVYFLFFIQIGGNETRFGSGFPHVTIKYVFLRRRRRRTTTKKKSFELARLGEDEHNEDVIISSCRFDSCFLKRRRAARLI